MSHSTDHNSHQGGGQEYPVWDVVTAVQNHLRERGLPVDVRRGEGRAALQAASELLRTMGVAPVLDQTAYAVMSTDEPWTDRDDRAADAARAAGTQA